MTKMANLKGNLGVKSSRLAPTSSKLSTQYLVLDHMNNHYNKISKAKSAIDNKPPKSLQTSQKLRDRKTRQRVMSPTRTTPVPHAQDQGDLEYYQDVLNDEPEDEEERLAYSIMKSTLGKKTPDSHKATYNSEYRSNGESWGSDQYANNFDERENFSRTNHATFERPTSARSVRSVRSVTSTQRGNRVPLHHPDPTKVTYNGDVIDKRAHCFTEPAGLFTPRTLKTNHESRLKNSKCYNPPKRPKSAQNGAFQSTSQSSFVSEKSSSLSKTHPRPQPRQRVKSTLSDDLGDTLPTSQLSETMLMDLTLQSRDGRRLQNGKGQVPPLAISMDADHMNWLQEQASKAQVRARHSGKFRKSLVSQTNGGGLDDAESGDPDGLSKSVRLEKLKKEEEQKYLAFAKEVTDDVLATGISSDRVLNKLFENHIDRRKDELDEDRMRAVVRDLKKNLGLREQSPVSTEHKKRPRSRHSNEDAASEKSASRTPTRRSTDNLSEASSMKERSTRFTTNGVDSGNTLMVNGNDTLDSTSTMKFGQTADMFSTIHTEGRGEDDTELSDGELMTTKKGTTDDNDDLSATQALKQYQMNLTQKDASSEVSGSEGGGHTGDELLDTISERPATGEMREGSTGQITIETGTSANGHNATDTSPILSSDLTPGSATQNSEISPGLGTMSQDSNSYSQLMPQTKPRARRRNRANNSSSSETNESSTLTKNGNGVKNGQSTSGGSWSEKESENGEEAPKPSRLRRAAKIEEIDRETQDGEEGGNNGDENAEKNGTDEIKEEDDYASDYEDESVQEDTTHRTSDDEF